MNDPVIALTRAAELLGVTERTVRSFLKSGELEGAKQGRSWRVSFTSVAELADCQLSTVNCQRDGCA